MATKNIIIKGLVIDQFKKPLPHLRIEAWDKDGIVDDFLAETETDEAGNFIMEFSPKQFVELPKDNAPDVYFKIYRGQILLKSTMDSIMHNLGRNITGVEIMIELGADQPSETPPSTPMSFQLPGDNSYTVIGQVFQNGKPLSNAVVKAFDQDLPSKKVSRHPLGKPATTNKEGRYKIEYQEEQFKRAENLSADIVLTVTNPNDELLHTTQVQFNAPRQFFFDIRFETENERSKMVEFERYQAELNMLLDGEVAVEQLTEEDLTFLGRETEIPTEHLSAFHQAFLLQEELSIDAPFFYALFRQNLSRAIATWAIYQPNDLVELYNRSAKEKIVKKQDTEMLLDAAHRVLSVCLQKSLETPIQSQDAGNIASLGDILGTVLPTVERQTHFLELYHGFQGQRSDFWKELRASKEFGHEADHLAFTLQVSKISLNNKQLIDAINVDPNLNHLDDLVALDVTEWQQLILKNNTVVPSHIFGVDDNQKAENYAKSIAGLLESSYPNEFVAKTVRQNESVNPDLIQFLQNKESGFSITRTPVDTYLGSDDGIQAFAQINDRERAIEELKTLQRLYNITGESKLMHSLMDAGVKSAHQLASMPLEQYMMVMEDSGIETQTLFAIHAQATQKTETNVILLKELQDYHREILPRILADPSDSVEEMVIGIPDYETLFGSLDSCDCGHCRSVYSATAYFVELLHELLGGKFAVSTPSLANPIRRLFDRRPDLQFIKLTCENTETEIPYIDVVNEILETYIGIGELNKAHTRDTSNFTAQELAANPQFIVEQAHTLLRGGVFPTDMPFDLHLETAREFFKYLGSSRDEVLSTFLPNNANAAQKNAHLAESITLSEREFEILTEVNFAGDSRPVLPHTLYGYADNSANLGSDARVRNVAKFLERTSISYDDLIAILKTSFINPLWHVADYLQDPTIAENPTELSKRTAFIGANTALIAEVDSTVIVLSAPVTNACNLNLTNIVFRNNTNLSDANFAKINRFIRLWKKLGCSIEEADLLLTAFGENANITALAVQRIAQALLVNRTLELPIENLVSLWGNIPHVGKKSLYHRQFLNKAALKIDGNFGLNTQQAELALTNRPIDQHIPALLAAFKVSEEDIAAIRRLTNLHTATSMLSIANVSTIYRYTALAKAVNLKVLELVSLLKLMPNVNPLNINAILDTLELTRANDLINQSTFSIEQLRFMYQSQEGIDAPFMAKASVINQLAKTIGEGLDKLVSVDERKDFVRSAWATAFRLEEKTTKFVLSQIPAIETNALALKSSDVSLALSVVADPVPDSVTAARALLKSFTESYNQLNKIAILINGFKLKEEELAHFRAREVDFDEFNLSHIPLTFNPTYLDKGFKQWLRLANYSGLKKQFGVTDDRFIKVFAEPDFQKKLTALQIATNWSEGTLKDLMGGAFGQGAFLATVDDYRNEKVLLKFVEAYQLGQTMGLTIKKLSSWTLAVTPEQSMDIKNTVRANYEENQWFEVAKNVNNILREKNRDALVSYLLNLPAIKALNIHDTNDLYAYFLIDVEMQSCMMTSRIVQANASIQLFIQRILMNMELNVSPSEINEKRWKWMKKYRVWEANRKVFLYPENWIEPELRDSKSPFFKELESSLLQGEVNQENVEKALKNYLAQLDTVAKLDVRAMFEDTSKKELHVVARTAGIPHQYFYRKFSTKSKVWTAWKKVETDIEGENLCMTVWNKRLMLFWLSKTEKAKPHTPEQRLAGANAIMETEYKLNWSEHKDSTWQPKKISKYSHTQDSTDAITFIYPRISNGTLKIVCGTRELTPETGFWMPDSASTALKWREVALFTFDSCQSDCRTTHNIQEYTSRYNDKYEELIGGWGVLGLSRESGLKKIVDFTDDVNTDSQVTSTHIPRFVPGEYFFVGTTEHCYFVKSNSYKVPLAVGPMEKVPLEPKLPEIEFYTPYRPWQDDPRPGFEWDAPYDYEIEFDSSVLIQSPKQFFQDKMIGEAAEPMMLMGEAGAPLMMTMQAMSNDNGNLQFESSSSEIPIAKEYMHGAVAKIERFGGIAKNMLATDTSFEFFNFYHAFVCEFVKSINTGGVDALMSMNNQKLGERNSQYRPIPDNNTHFNITHHPQSNVATPYPHSLVDFSESGAYSIYNWELFFHVPMLIANRLSKNQRFEESMRWYHFIFNPMSTTNESSPKRFWNVLPFKITPQESIQQLLAKLQLPDGHADKVALKHQIEEWRDNPFNPHLLARMRLMAYMKNTVMKYLDNLISWGDNLFQRETREYVMEAIQIYILASDLLGKKPTKIGMRGKTTSESYDTLKTKLDAFQNAAVSMETFFPHYSESPVSNSGGSAAPNLTNIVQTFYFCIPDNEKLLGYWDKVADRLFKIRNCQNIDGLQLKLSLFEPAIDPALLVQATAQGLDLGSVLADIPSSSPLYKFQYTLQKAMEFTNELKSIGGSLLAAIEKKDAEEFSMLRTQHEAVMLQLTKETKKMQYLEAVKNRENTLKSRESAVARWQHYSKLLGVQELKVPDFGQNIKALALPESAADPVDSRLISGYENQDLTKAAESASAQGRAGTAETLAGILHAIPNWNAQPLGMGATFGGSNLGSLTNAYASHQRSESNKSSVDASRASKLGGFFRREQDWVLQCNSAANEIMAIDKQILAAEIRIDLAAKERENHDRQIENSREVEAYMKSKFSNSDLYGWMQGELSTVYFQTYQMAFDLAKKAELSYRHELGIESSNFIQFGYWDSFKKGLLAGDKLALSLRQLEKAYMEGNKRDYEMIKHVSLASLDPLALIKLKTTGVCEFEIPEVLYDMDNPGQFFRRIKSVSVSIPCIAGPYTSVNATLSLTGSRYRKNASHSSGYPETGLGDTRFHRYTSGTQSIATSHGQNDSGVFELNFKDERYVPFEGAGAISSWNLELPTGARLFDYNTIADVVMHIKYTAKREGNTAFKNAVNNSVRARLNSIRRAIDGDEGLHYALNLTHDMANEWHQLKSTRSVNLQLHKSRLPYLVQALQLNLENVQFVARLKSPTGTYTINVGGDLVMTAAWGTNNIKLINHLGLAFDTPFTLSIPAGQNIDNLEELMLVVNYKFVPPPAL